MRSAVIFISFLLTFPAWSLPKLKLPAKVDPVAAVSGQLDEYKTFNAKTGTVLAMQQDSLILGYVNGKTEISPNELKDLINNEWVKKAKHLAPSNLILRQWGLIDLFAKTPGNAKRILEMMELLSYGPADQRLWAEGYSYWLYCKQVLPSYVAAFPADETAIKIKSIMDAVDMGFAATAYDRNGVLYPAPYGDLRDEPLLEPAVSMRKAMADAPKSHAWAEVTKIEGGLKYTFKGAPIGMNTHILVESKTVEVKNGIPAGFKFYTGYSEKYSTPDGEQKDMMNPKRLKSIDDLKLKSKFN